MAEIQLWSLKGKDSSCDCQYYGTFMGEISKLTKI